MKNFPIAEVLMILLGLACIGLFFSTHSYLPLVIGVATTAVNGWSLISCLRKKPLVAPEPVASTPTEQTHWMFEYSSSQIGAWAQQQQSLNAYAQQQQQAQQQMNANPLLGLAGSQSGYIRTYYERLLWEPVSQALQGRVFHSDSSSISQELESVINLASAAAVQAINKHYAPPEPEPAPEPFVYTGPSELESGRVE